MPLVGVGIGAKLFEWFVRLWPLWLAIALAVFAIGALKVHDNRVAKAAREAVVAEYEPKLRQCEDTKRQAAMALEQSRRAMVQLQESYAAQSAAVAELREREAQARKKGQLEVAKALVKERELLSRIERLQGALAAPAATEEMGCEEAERILREGAERRATVWEGDG